MQIVSQETILQAESEGQLYLDHQVSTIQCINEWRIKTFDAFNLTINEYIPRLQLDIIVIKQSLISPENSNKVSFTLGQIGIMDILRLNFKSCQKRLKQFLVENQDSLSYNLVNDLMNNSQLLSDYFNYDHTFHQQQQNLCENQIYHESQYEQHSSEEETQNQLNFEDEYNDKNNDNKNIDINYEQNDEIFLDFEDNTNNSPNLGSPNSQENYNFFDSNYTTEYNTEQEQMQKSNNFPQHFILLE